MKNIFDGNGVVLPEEKPVETKTFKCATDELVKFGRDFIDKLEAAVKDDGTLKTEELVDGGIGEYDGYIYSSTMKAAAERDAALAKDAFEQLFRSIRAVACKMVTVVESEEFREASAYDFTPGEFETYKAYLEDFSKDSEERASGTDKYPSCVCAEDFDWEVLRNCELAISDLIWEDASNFDEGYERTELFATQFAKLIYLGLNAISYE